MQKPDSDKLSFAQKIAYAIGGAANNFMGNGITALALPIYNIGLGVSASLIGLALGIPRVLDALIDPIMGHISDNTRSRWGRRRPYLVFGGIACAITFALLWNPNMHWSKNTLFAFFFTVSMIYYISFTVWSIPYGALGFELSYDYNERTNIQAYRTVFACVFGLTLPWLYKMCFWSWNKLIAPNEGTLVERLSLLTRKSHIQGTEVSGAGIVGIIIGVIILITALIPAVCKERAETQTQEKCNLKDSFKSTFKNKPFIIITVAGLLAFFGLFVIAPLGLYMNIYYIFKGNREAAATLAGWAGTFYTLMGIVSIPFVTKAANKIGKKLAMVLGLGFTGFGYLSMWWLYTPAHPWWQLIPFIFIGPAWNCAMIVLPSMIADICDMDELETGLRREGTFSAINGWLFKMAIGAVTCITGLVVAIAGINPDAATQTASTILKMRLMFVGLPVIFLGTAAATASLYPITERRAREVRAILNTRKKNIPLEHNDCSPVRK